MLSAFQRILILLLLLLPGMAAAHEFWIDAEYPIADRTERLRADARVGQFFIGDALPYLPETIARLGVVDSRGVRALQPLIGDQPVFDTPSRIEGVHILFLETTPKILTWESAEKFLEFLREKRLDRIYDEHRKRGLPEAGFKENYVRHAKALVLRGKHDGEMDRALGLKLELVALDDPFRMADGGELRVRLLWQGKPLGGVDVQVFSRPAGRRDVEARPQHLTTDEQGIARVAVQGGRDYLINAVIMRAQPASAPAPWISHWASLTFSTPAWQPATRRKNGQMPPSR